MRRVLVGLLGVGLILAACGSGGESPESTGTATSERVERQTTVSEQQTQQQTAEPQPLQQAQQMEQPQQIQVEEEDINEEPQADELPTEIVGTHKGVRSEGRVLGEPDAPVLIEHFGDFT